MIKLRDQNSLVPTSDFPYAQFPFETFNPVQSRVFEVYKEPGNFIIAAATSAGKTVCCEMFTSYEVRERGGKGMYLSPLRALSQEKIDDWTDKKHHFNDLNLSICTGDYRLTDKRRKEIEKSNVLIFTTEMINSRARNQSENNSFLKDVGTLVVDESHILTVPGRGDHIESGIMKFSELNPKGRIVLLSATMPNVDELGEWLNHITGRETYLLESTYRPCPLFMHYPRYRDQGSYDEIEGHKINAAMEIMVKHSEDKFLFFVHTKRTGERLYAALQQNMVPCEYHNADLSKEKRVDIEQRFKTGSLRAIVATSTLAWGCNLPSRRVVVLGVHRGLSEVANYDIAQMSGRAGRPQYDKQGDAYILLPTKDFGKHLARLQQPALIESQMMDRKTLAFHLVNEIYHGGVKTRDDIDNWYSRTFASFQKQELDEGVLEEAMMTLSKCGAIRNKDDNYDSTSIGAVSSLFYYSPYDVSDLARNWGKLFELGNQNDDLWISIALGNTDTHRGGIVSAAEREEVAAYRYLLSKTSARGQMVGTKDFADGAAKVGCAYWHLLRGKASISLAGLVRGLQQDFERVVEVLNVIDSLVGRWGNGDYFKRLHMRVLHGVSDDLVDLCSLKGISKIKANKLWEANLRTLADIAKHRDKVMKAIKCSEAVADKIAKEALSLIYR